MTICRHDLESIHISMRPDISCAKEHTAIQRRQDPWLDRVKIDTLYTLTPRKQLSLYFT
jgi:hypothetical protein